ncbi:hypothetical protein [Reyranella soli]|uniref:Uncharacterized protein n=1 Tax=Reyranella soli TaxID=1230389 RepID=A0A512NQ14_9HYPH|nr:hypothetical protein [Reyranella soli]GEP61044.1 hypothetical protein RSO01_82100 [Reyranella soli]
MTDVQMQAQQARYDEHMKLHGDRCVTWKMLMGMIEQTMAALAKPLIAHEEQLDALAKEVAELRAAQTKTLADSFRGTWIAGTVFARGSLVTHDGSLFLAMVDGSEKPGTSSEWKLVTKRGRDGKDAR